MANLSLVFDILARDSASKTFTDVGNAAERSGKKAESGLAAITNGAKLAGGALLGAGVIAGFRELYDAAAESQRITRLTESAIRSTGGAAKISADQVGDLAAAISAKTGIDDEAIQSGQNLLLTFTNIRNEAGEGNAIFDRTSEILADMSTVLGTDAAGSATQLGKALNDPIAGLSSLSRAGVQFTDQQKEQIRTLVESGDTLGAQRIILDELTTQFGGAAEAAATPLDKMRVSIGNVVEALGTNLIPLVDDFATGAVTAIEGVSAGFESGQVTADGFEGAMQGVGVAIGDVVEAGQAVAGVGSDVVGFVSSIPAPAQAAAGALGAFVLLKGPVGDALETIALKSLYAKDSVGGLTGGLGSVKGAASGLLGVLGGPWGVAMAGAAAGVAYVASEMADADAQTQNWTQSILDGSVAADDLSEAYLAQYGGDKPDWLQQQSELLGFTSSLEDAEANARELYEAMDPLAQAQQNVTYDTNRLVQAIDEFGEGSPEATQAAELLAASNERLAGRQDAVTRATEAATAAQAGAVPTAEAFTASMDEVATQVSDAKKEVDAYKLSLDVLTGANVSLIDVQSAYFDSLEFSYEALAGLEGAVASANGQLNLQSEAGRFASETQLDVRDSGNQLIATLIEQGSTAEDVRLQDAQLRESFIATADEMGFSADEAINLANQILGIPTEREVQIDADIASASGNLTDLQTQIDGLRGKDITIRASTALSGLNGGPIPVGGRAAGGPIHGPGTGTSDTAGLYALSNGEHVWTAVEVAAAGGHSAVESLRREVIANGGGFAAGGAIVNIGLPSLAGLTIDAPAEALASFQTVAGAAGSGSVGGGWESIWAYVKARIPQARQNSTFRPGDPGYHGRGKAIDFGFGSGPGGAGSAGLASIEALLYDGLGRNLAEIIYDGVGNSRPDVKNGRDHTYSAGTRAEHANHVHAATYDAGGMLMPGYTLAYNGTGEPERIRTSEQEAALGQQVVVNARIFVGNREITDIARVEAETVTAGALGALADGTHYQGGAR